MPSRRDFLKQTGLAAGLTVLGAARALAQQPGKKGPNVLWLYIEDMNPLLSCYGDENISTPNMDRLAAGGVLFENAFAPTPVCSPCRSAVITGAMSTTFGLHNHRSGRGKDVIDLPAGVRTLPEILRAAGYFTYNKGKDDYNFTYDREALYSKENDWRARAEGQPFFAQIQLAGGKYVFRKKEWEQREWRIDREKAAATLPACYPRHPVMIEHWAMHYEAVKLTDDAVGAILDRLEEDGLIDDTVVFLFSDHGCYLPRHKQFCYDGGIRAPLLVSWPGGKERVEPGTRRSDLVSLIDVTATTCALAGLPVPDWYEGRNLFAPEYRERGHIIAVRDRCDYTIDRIRAVRTHDFKYIRNFMTDRPYMQPQYRDGSEYMETMRRLHRDGELAPEQAWFWSSERPAEELFDLRSDPGELRSVARDPAHAEHLQRLRRILDAWIAETDDKGQYPESTAGLGRVFERWKAKCVNPEYDRIR
jgi:arylsulfatase A-like enzyme